MSAGKAGALAALEKHANEINAIRTVLGSGSGMNIVAMCDSLNKAVIELRETRAAVAELIEAANALLAATGRASAGWPLLSDKRVAWGRVNAALRAAVAADPHNGTTASAVALAKVKP